MSGLSSSCGYCWRQREYKICLFVSFMFNRRRHASELVWLMSRCRLCGSSPSDINFSGEHVRGFDVSVNQRHEHFPGDMGSLVLRLTSWHVAKENCYRPQLVYWPGERSMVMAIPRRWPARWTDAWTSIVKDRSSRHALTMLRRGYLGIGQVGSVKRRSCDMTDVLSS